MSKKKAKNEFVKLDKTYTSVEFRDLDTATLPSIQVDCHNCPVSMLCMAAGSDENSAVSICAKCSTASVALDKKADSDDISHILLVDCTKSNFRSPKKDDGEGCLLCNRRFVKQEILKGQKQDIPFGLFTIHSKVKVQDRQAMVKESWDYWDEQRKLRDAAIAKCAAEVKAKIEEEKKKAEAASK